MRIRIKTGRLLIVLCCLISGATTSMAAAGDYRSAYVFGDSLSDPGNAYALSGTSAIPPYETVPSAPYAVGGFHFTNGKTWAERVTAKLGIPKGGKAAFAKPGRFGNYAIGQSRAGSNASPLLTFGGQIAAFLQDTGGVAPADALYLVWFGGNDIRDALFAAFSDPTLATSQATIAAAVEAEAQGVAQLYAAGARHFLVLNAPNAALAPIVSSQGPVAVGATLLLNEGSNAGLDAALDELAAGLPGIQITRIDIFTIVSDIVADPRSAGFSNAVDPCVSFGVTKRVYCSQRNRYLFWDAVHPTAKAHRKIAQIVLDVLDSD